MTIQERTQIENRFQRLQPCLNPITTETRTETEIGRIEPKLSRTANSNDRNCTNKNWNNRSWKLDIYVETQQKYKLMQNKQNISTKPDW